MSAPEIKVVKGNPTEDELAALRTVLAQMSAKPVSYTHLTLPTKA